MYGILLNCTDFRSEKSIAPKKVECFKAFLSVESDFSNRFSPDLGRYVIIAHFTTKINAFTAKLLTLLTKRLKITKKRRCTS